MSSPQTTLHQLIAWDRIPADYPAEGIERRMVWGERLMICRLRFDPYVVTAVHSHPHEQMTIVDRGRVRFSIDGQDHVAVAGDVIHFPANLLHGATILDEEVVLIDIFSPVREDFLQGQKSER